MINRHGITTSVTVSGGDFTGGERGWHPILWHFVPKHHTDRKQVSFSFFFAKPGWKIVLSMMCRVDRSLGVREAGLWLRGSKCGWETEGNHISTSPQPTSVEILLNQCDKRLQWSCSADSGGAVVEEWNRIQVLQRRSSSAPSAMSLFSRLFLWGIGEAAAALYSN